MDSNNKLVLYFCGAMLFCCLLIGVGFMIGRATMPTPDKIEEHAAIKDKVAEKTKTEEKEKKTEVLDGKKTEDLHVHREEKTVTAPDGSVVHTKTEDINKNKTEIVHDVVVVEKVRIQYVDRVTVQEKVIDRIVKNSAPQWKADLSLGIDFRRLDRLGTPFPATIVGDPFDVGLHVQRRIAGPFFFGIYGRTSLQAGVSLGFEW